MRVFLYLITIFISWNLSFAKEFTYSPGRTISTNISKKYNWIFLDGLQIKAIISPDDSIRIENTSNGVLLTSKAWNGKEQYISLITSLSDHIDLKVKSLDIEPQFIHIKVPLQKNYLRPAKVQDDELMRTLVRKALEGKLQFEPISKSQKTSFEGLELNNTGYFQQGKYKLEIWNIHNKSKQIAVIPNISKLNEFLGKSYLMMNKATTNLASKESTTIFLIAKRYD